MPETRFLRETWFLIPQKDNRQDLQNLQDGYEGNLVDLVNPVDLILACSG